MSRIPLSQPSRWAPLSSTPVDDRGLAGVLTSPKRSYRPYPTIDRAIWRNDGGHIEGGDHRRSHRRDQVKSSSAVFGAHGRWSRAGRTAARVGAESSARGQRAQVVADGAARRLRTGPATATYTAIVAAAATSACSARQIRFRRPGQAFHLTPASPFPCGFGTSTVGTKNRCSSTWTTLKFGLQAITRGTVRRTVPLRGRGPWPRVTPSIHTNTTRTYN